jgi:AcrR family transcriptional regulator
MLETNRKVDIRVIKTKKAIREGVLQLLSEKTIDDISITELAQISQINRKTFYNYYQNPHQVLDELESELVEEFVCAINASDWEDWYDGKNFDFHKIFSCVTKSVQENRETYRYLLKIRRTSDIMIKIENRLKVEAVEYFSKYMDVPHEFVEMVMEYVISGMFAVYQKWFHDGQQVPAEEVSKKIGVMSVAAVNGLFDYYNVNIARLEF